MQFPGIPNTSSSLPGNNFLSISLLLQVFYKVAKAASGLLPVAGTKYPRGPDSLLSGGSLLHAGAFTEATPALERGAASWQGSHLHRNNMLAPEWDAQGPNGAVCTMHSRAKQQLKHQTSADFFSLHVQIQRGQAVGEKRWFEKCHGSERFPSHFQSEQNQSLSYNEIS